MAIISISTYGMFDVRSTNGIVQLGGANFDICLFDFCVDHLKKDNLDIRSSKESIKLLLNECERAKKILSSAQETTIVVNWFKDEMYEIPIKRTDFEEMIDHLVAKTMVCVKRALDDANLKKENIDDIVLVGGTTFIPKVRASLAELLGKDVNTSINPMASVAIGAAIQAAVLEKKKNAPRILLKNVTPLSIGIFTAPSPGTVRSACIIKRNTAYPITVKRVGTSIEDNQTKMLMPIYEGKYVMENTNKLRP